jgi:hypothetical protein
MPRKLRIAASLFFAVVAVAVVALWLRSHRWADIVYLDVGAGHSAVSMRGTIYTDCGTSVLSRTDLARHRLGTITTFNVPNGDGGMTVIDAKLAIPLWSALLATCLAAAVPWLRWRFSLRMLLLATTLVSVLLWLGIRAAS